MNSLGSYLMTGIGSGSRLIYNRITEKVTGWWSTDEVYPSDSPAHSLSSISLVSSISITKSTTLVSSPTVKCHKSTSRRSSITTLRSVEFQLNLKQYQGSTSASTSSSRNLDDLLNEDELFVQMEWIADDMIISYR